ncbi:acyl transferase/acyl hydrolase/lysophospholipase [Flagelloscypha sp. PMI_526]|nr:acyl transferase/acyl hydrolase/lysophospholipase [Flagelloscypha sp. PMI_526]
MAISILVIDGESSSYSGVSSAMFNLREIMHRAAPDSERSDTSSQTSSNGGNDEARPCDCFDLIVGSGDGGWVAIMLGRLGMSVSQAINAYKEIHSAVHHAPQKLSKQERSAIFENHLKRLVQTHSVGGNPEEKLRMSKSGVRCQTVVLAMTSQNVALPTLFRTYKARKHRVDDCPVWMAIRACTSNPHLFPAAKIGDQLYVSASHAGQSNPIDFALSEAKVAYPDAGIHCIISLGSGHPGPISFSMPDMSSYSDVAINIAKDAERKAQQAAKQFHSTDQKIYFRFNVEQGLQNSVQATSGPHGEAQAHAAVYCARHEIDELLEAAVTQLLSSNCVDEKVPPSLQEGADSFEVQVSSIPQTQTYVNELYPLGFGFPLWDPHRRINCYLSIVLVLMLGSSFKTYRVRRCGCSYTKWRIRNPFQCYHICRRTEFSGIQSTERFCALAGAELLFRPSSRGYARSVPH